MAPLLALHETAPEQVARMIVPLADGRVEVHLPRGVRVTVDREMPVDAQGRWVCGRESGAGPGWVGVIEKALALHLAGSYRWLARGFGRSGLGAVTGLPVRSHLVRLPSATRLQQWIDEGRLVLASSHPGSRLVATPAGPWPSDHVMVVVGADALTHHVHLRNPWRPDAVLTVDRRAFRRAVLCVDVTAPVDVPAGRQRSRATRRR